MAENYRRKHWVTKEKIERWREGAERYAQENYDLRHRANFEIVNGADFIKYWTKFDITKIPTKTQAIEEEWFYRVKYILWAQDFPSLYPKREKPTKEHYILVDDKFNIVSDPMSKAVTVNIANGKIKKMINNGTLKEQSGNKIVAAKILLVSDEGAE